MAVAAVENAVPVSNESKSARKKKAKAEATTTTNGASAITAVVPERTSNENSAAADADATADHPYIKELQKQIRNANKKLSGYQKIDAILAENPGVSLDALVAQRKINNDQRSAAQKKPAIQAQLADLEERAEHYRKFDQEYQVKFNKQRDELTGHHEQALSKLREEARVEAAASIQKELRQKLLVFSQFLRCAAAKRIVEEESHTEESRAFEGALLLVYGGDQKAVDTAVSIIDGSSETVPTVESELTNITCKCISLYLLHSTLLVTCQIAFSIKLALTISTDDKIKELSIEHAPFQAEETWIDQVAEATGATNSDPTIVNAGLTELEAPTTSNGNALPTPAAAAHDDTSGNLAGERWDTDAAGTSAGAEKSGLEESYEIVPRPSEEVDVPVETVGQSQPQSWAEESHEAATGNQAGEAWATKAPGEEDNTWGKDSAITSTNGWSNTAEATPATTDNDGFSEVPGRVRGRGGQRGRGSDGEFRGRGGRRGNFRGRGDGEFRGGRGGGGARGSRGEGGEGRGRGRGRGGPRGGNEGGAARGA